MSKAQSYANIPSFSASELSYFSPKKGKTGKQIQSKTPSEFSRIANKINASFKAKANKQIITDLDKELATFIANNKTSITPQEIESAINIFSSKNHQITLSLTKILNEYIAERSNEFDLNKLLSNYVSLGASPNETIYNIWKDSFIYQINHATANELNHAIWLHEKLSIIPNEEFLNCWIAKTISTISTFPQEKALSSLWALSTLKFNNKISNHINLHDTISALKTQIDTTNFASLTTDTQHKLLTTDYLNNKDILTNWQRQSIIDAYKLKSPTHSELQIKAFKKLHTSFKSNIELEEEAWIEELAIRVDGYIKNKNLVIQIDGNKHFTNDFDNNSCTNFQTELNTKLLENLGYRVIRISTYDMAKKGWEASCVEQINMLSEDKDTTELDDPIHDATDHETVEGSDIASLDGEVSIYDLMRSLSNEESELDLIGNSI